MGNFRNLIECLGRVGLPTTPRDYPPLEGFQDDVRRLSADAHEVARGVVHHTVNAIESSSLSNANAAKDVKRTRK